MQSQSEDLLDKMDELLLFLKKQMVASGTLGFEDEDKETDPSYHLKNVLLVANFIEENTQPDEREMIEISEIMEARNKKTARDLKACAQSWDPLVRLVGNVQALDIVKLCDDYLKNDHS